MEVRLRAKPFRGAMPTCHVQCVAPRAMLSALLCALMLLDGTVAVAPKASSPLKPSPPPPKLPTPPYADHKGAVPEGCLAREGSEAFHACTSAVGAVCDAKQEEYDFVVNLLRGANVFGHFCESRTCGGAGSCHADDSGAFNGYLSAMQAAREDPALLDALSKHAERKKYEVASYIACWDPNSQYGQVMDVAGEYVLSSATGCRIQEFDMRDEPSHNVFSSRSLDARDINGADGHTRRLGVALMSRSYPTEALHWTVERTQDHKKTMGAEPSESDAGESMASEDEDSEDSAAKPASPLSKKRKAETRAAAAAAAQPAAATDKPLPPNLVLFKPPIISRGRVKEVCGMLSNSKSAWNPALIRTEGGQFAFNSASRHHRPGKDEFSALPLYLSRRFTSFIYDPVRRFNTSGGFAALCAAIEAAHHGRTVDRLYLDGSTIGGWGARLPDVLAGGDFNTFMGPLALEKQVGTSPPPPPTPLQ